MSRDQTLQEEIETVLYHFGVKNSGVIASEIVNTIEESNFGKWIPNNKD